MIEQAKDINSWFSHSGTFPKPTSISFAYNYVKGVGTGIICIAILNDMFIDFFRPLQCKD